MNYTIFTRIKVEPKYFPSGALNTGLMPEYPAGAGLIYQPASQNIYSDNPADRLELLSDPNGTATWAEIIAAFPLIKEPKKADIRAAGSKWMKYITGEYSEEEKQTFTLQQQESEDWLANNAAECLTIRNMAMERGITVAEMTAKIMENVPPFKRGLGIVMGKQQRLLDQINVVTDYDALQAINW